MRELRVEDALMYLDQVKMEFGDRPHIYNEFLDIMKNFKSQQLDTPGVIERVSNLFHGNKKLVLGFNTFLPEGYKIELPIDGAPAVYHAPGQAGVTQINGPGSASRTTSGTVSSMAVAAPPMPSAAAAAGRGHAMGSSTHGRPVGPPQVSNKMTQPTMHAHSHPQSSVSAATSLGVVVGQQQQQQQKRFVPGGVPAVTSVASPDTQQALNARQRLAMAERQGRDQAEQAQLQQQPQAARNDHMWKGVRPPSNVMPNTAAIPQQTGISPAAAVASGPVSSTATVSSIQPPAPGQPVEFDYAINYVTNIKKRFANQPDTYKNFLKILHTYQKEQRGIKEVLNEVSELFADHPDLLQEFTYFLPDAVQAAAKAQLATAVKLAEGRKKKNVQETAAHVAEARTQAILRAKIAYREQKQNIRPVGPPEEPLQRQQPSVVPSDLAGSVTGLPSAVSVPPTTPSTAPPQAPQPPPIPFGATQGRSEEREREICRSAVHGQVSFAPVRPPKM